MAKHSFLKEGERGLIYAALLESARQYRDLAKQPAIIANKLADQFNRQSDEAEQLAERIESADDIKLISD